MIYHGFFGFLFGFAVLHPVSMVIFHHLDPGYGNRMSDQHQTSSLHAFVSSFRPHMFPMGLVYGLLCSAVAVVNGRQRATIKQQRDHLAQQLAQNERYRLNLQEQADLLRMQNERLARLERVNRRNTRFMVHDFKTHVGCILGFADLLLEKAESPRDQEAIRALERIRRKAHQMKGAIADLLDLARIQETARIRREEISAARLLAESANDFALPEHENRIVIGQGNRDCPAVWGDHGLLKRVLTNLISNALKHNSPDTRVWLDAENRTNPSEVLFTCTDNGGGIPNELLPSLFEEFHTSETGDSESSGLGLAFCKAAVEAHGGRIGCTSGDSGTQFYFALPIKEEVCDESREHAQETHSRGGG
jgi:signal transduction histidine kinase